VSPHFVSSSLPLSPLPHVLFTQFLTSSLRISSLPLSPLPLSSLPHFLSDLLKKNAAYLRSAEVPTGDFIDEKRLAMTDAEASPEEKIEEISDIEKKGDFHPLK
jgi:hypothetical protein